MTHKRRRESETKMKKMMKEKMGFKEGRNPFCSFFTKNIFKYNNFHIIKIKG